MRISCNGWAEIKQCRGTDAELPGIRDVTRLITGRDLGTASQLKLNQAHRVRNVEGGMVMGRAIGLSRTMIMMMSAWMLERTGVVKIATGGLQLLVRANAEPTHC